VPGPSSLCGRAARKDAQHFGTGRSGGWPSAEPAHPFGRPDWRRAASLARTTTKVERFASPLFPSPGGRGLGVRAPPGRPERRQGWESGVVVLVWALIRSGGDGPLERTSKPSQGRAAACVVRSNDSRKYCVASSCSRVAAVAGGRKQLQDSRAPRQHEAAVMLPAWKASSQSSTAGAGCWKYPALSRFSG
jgi:hypothetical protein